MVSEDQTAEAAPTCNTVGTPRYQHTAGACTASAAPPGSCNPTLCAGSPAVCQQHKSQVLACWNLLCLHHDRCNHAALAACLDVHHHEQPPLYKIGVQNGQTDTSLSFECEPRYHAIHMHVYAGVPDPPFAAVPAALAVSMYALHKSDL